MVKRYKPQVMVAGSRKFRDFAGKVTFGLKKKAMKFLKDAKKIRSGLTTKDKKYRIIVVNVKV